MSNVSAADTAGTGQRILSARVAQLQQALFGAGEDFVRLFFADDAAIDQLLRCEDDPA